MQEDAGDKEIIHRQRERLEKNAELMSKTEGVSEKSKEPNTQGEQAKKVADEEEQAQDEDLFMHDQSPSKIDAGDDEEFDALFMSGTSTPIPDRDVPPDCDADEDMDRGNDDGGVIDDIPQLGEDNVMEEDAMAQTDGISPEGLPNDDLDVESDGQPWAKRSRLARLSKPAALETCV